MSKHRPPASPGPTRAGPDIGAVTADSPLDDIRAERMRVAKEMLRRKEYAYLLMLKAELDGLPPVPEAHAPPANEA